MEDKLVTFNVGKFGVILTRKQLMYAALVIFLMLFIHVFVLYEEGHNHEAVPITGITWAAFKTDCGYDAFS